MSDKENYDKILLTSGIVLGLGMAAWGVLTFTGLSDTHKLNTAIPDKAPEKPAGIATAKSINEQLLADHVLKPIKIGNQEYVGFVAPKLWVKIGDSVPFDIIAGPAIHGDIPNKWFLDNGLAEDFVFDDVLSRDPDGDGFTVEEEYRAGTHPNDAASHPDLTDKLLIADKGIKMQGFYLIFNQAEGDKYTFKAQARNEQELWKDSVTLNSNFGVRKGSKDPARFQLVSVVEKEFKHPSMDMTEKALEATVKDLKATKNGQTYTVRMGAKYRQTILDRKVILTITAGPNSGESFEVEEGADFVIPGTKAPVFTMKAIDNAEQTVTIADKKTGTRKTISKKK